MAIEEKDLPLTGDPYRNVDASELDAISPLVQDAYIDELGYTQKRPGLPEFIDLGTSAGVDGLFWWDKQNVAIAVSAGRVWKITDATGTNAELLGTTLSSGTKVKFSPNGSTLVMANGGKMVHTDLSTLTQMADGDAPTAVTHVGFLDGYTLANASGGQVFHNSDINAPTAWGAASVQQANGAPDNLLGLSVGWREIFLIGNDSLEIWYDDGVSPFSRTASGLIESGTSAVYTVQQVGGAWMWLDEKRHFVRLDRRTPTMISTPFNQQIQSFLTVNDAVSDVMEIDGNPLYIVSFPSAKRTFAYNYQKETWSDWGYWNTVSGQYDRFRGNCYCFARPWNAHLVGDHSNGKIYKASRSTFSDNGEAIRTLRRTGHVSHGTTRRKFSRELHIRCKRSVANAGVSDPQMFVRWRNDGGAWGNEHWVSLGQVGQHEYIARLKHLGSYRVRQWEFGHTDATDFILMGAKEYVELGTS